MRHEVTRYENGEGDPLYRIVLESENGVFEVEEHNGRNWTFLKSFQECRDAVSHARGLLDDE